MEVFAALALDVAEHDAVMTVPSNGAGAPPAFYTQYVQEVLELVRRNARAEFDVIWSENQARGTRKVELTKIVSAKINAIQDSAMQNLDLGSPLFDQILDLALPAMLRQHCGVAKIKQNVPGAYLKAVVGSWLASHYVYEEGVMSNEFNFFKFMQSCMGKEADGSPHRKRDSSTQVTLAQEIICRRFKQEIALDDCEKSCGDMYAAPTSCADLAGPSCCDLGASTASKASSRATTAMSTGLAPVDTADLSPTSPKTAAWADDVGAWK
jgi:hypothetical protein